MKKIISIVLVLTMIFGIFSCNAFAADTLTEAAIDKINSSDEFHMSIVVNDGYDEKEFVINRKGDNISFETMFPVFEGVEILTRVVVKNNTFKMYFPKFPFFCFEFDTDWFSLVVSDIETTDISSMTLMESYEETIRGETYNIEIFEDTDGTIYKYTLYNGNIVKSEEVTAEGKVLQSTNYTEIKTETDLFAFFTPLISIKLNGIIEDLS